MAPIIAKLWSWLKSAPYPAKVEPSRGSITVPALELRGSNWNASQFLLSPRGQILLSSMRVIMISLEMVHGGGPYCSTNSWLFPRGVKIEFYPCFASRMVNTETGESSSEVPFYEMRVYFQDLD